MQDADVQDILSESMEQGKHPVTPLSLEEILYRRSEWHKIMRSKRSSELLLKSLTKLEQIVDAVGGFPDRCHVDKYD